uniref:Uncharacterized protein n=1 Tax=Anguilla anguilla TaxID=7936 RepID=A0A0E9RHY2_ANGAN
MCVERLTFEIVSPRNFDSFCSCQPYSRETACAVL